MSEFDFGRPIVRIGQQKLPLAKPADEKTIWVDVVFERGEVKASFTFPVEVDTFHCEEDVRNLAIFCLSPLLRQLHRQARRFYVGGRRQDIDAWNDELFDDGSRFDRSKDFTR